MDKFELIKRNTQEIIQESELKSVMKKKNPIAYLGYAPTGRMHVGHMIPIYKIKDFVRAGFKFKFLLADLHSYLDDMKTPWSLLDARAEYYKQAVTGVLEAFGVDLRKIEFIKGSSYQFKESYMMNVLRMTGDVTLNRSRRAASEVVRFKEDPKLGGFLYPLMQIEDVYALNADVAYSGIDQRGIYMLGRDMADRFKRRKYVCVFTPLLPGLSGSKMSASDESSKIDVLDNEVTVKKKVNKAYCEAGVVKDNGVLCFVENVIIPNLQDKKKKFVIKRSEKFGGNLGYSDYKSLEKDFANKKLHPMDLKNAVAEELNKLLIPVRKRFAKKKDLLKKAYPKF
jgi:tyrosyl-tRNA synthetase